MLMTDVAKRVLYVFFYRKEHELFIDRLPAYDHGRCSCVVNINILKVNLVPYLIIFAPS